jgi:hypothetical protein
LTPARIRDGKKSGSGITNPDLISESSKTIFEVKILIFFDANPGWKKFGSGIRDKHPGSATLSLEFYICLLDVQAPPAAAAAGAVLGDQRAGREGGGRQPPPRDLQIRAQRPGHQDPPSTEDLRMDKHPPSEDLVMYFSPQS